MPYSEFVFHIPEQETKEVLIAILESIGFEGFEEDNHLLKAYTSQTDFSPQHLKTILSNFSVLNTLDFKQTVIPDENWNAIWEKNYQPVVINNEVAILTSFHDKIPGVKYEIIIDPKMSFGTGHHATTYMMIETMLSEDFKGKTVLDFGSGTGILSILASKMGAKEITAIDHEDWAFENMKENFEKNNVARVTAALGNQHSIPDDAFDLVLANVNKNVILESLEILAYGTSNGGKILFSGILTEDENEVLNPAKKFGLKLESKKVKSEWLCLKMMKNDQEAL